MPHNTFLTTFLLIFGILFAQPISAQNATPTPPPPVVSVVNGTPITAPALITRMDAEAWLLTQEIVGFAGTFYANNPDTDALVETVNALYGVQLAGLEDNIAYAETVLTSMEVDIILRGLAVEQEIDVTTEQVDTLIFQHITLAQRRVTPPTEDDLPLFFETAATEIDASEAALRTLFEGRVLREVFFRAVTATLNENDPERTQADNVTFQRWAFEQYRAASVERAADWATVIPQTDYRGAVTTALAEVIAAGL